MLTILITGFGPFPTAPANPTGPLVHRLARIRRPALANVRLVPHVFATSYQAVDRELPRLIARHAPDAMLMFGLAGRRRALSVETRARNAVSTLLPDVTGGLSAGRMIARGAPGERLFVPWCRGLPRALRTARVPAYLSRDAGRYVCNYLCWRAIEQTGPEGPLLAFVHVPKIVHGPHRRRSRRALTADDLVRAGAVLLLAVTAEARRRHPH
jgi:pyroglutamyl-peptidase